MAEIIPAILPAEYEDLRGRLSVIAGHAPLAHIDVCDGTLAPESTWPYTGPSEEWQRILHEEQGFPYWEEMNFEAHLMVADPEAIYGDWIRAGAERVIVHYEAFRDDAAVSSFLTGVAEHFAGDNGHLKVEVGLALDLDTPIAKILDHVLESDFIHLMSIPRIGSQGESFDEAVFDKIRELRSSYPETIIAVDGGVSLENARALVEAGVERLCVGSAIWQAEDPLEALEDLIMEVE